MKSIKWLIILILVLGYGAPCLYAGEIEQIRAKGELVVSLNRDYPPFAMTIDGQPTGLDVDLAKLLAEYLGVKVRFIQPETYDQQIPKLLAGESDIIIAAMTRTVERGLNSQLYRSLFRSEPGGPGPAGTVSTPGGLLF